MEKAFRDVLEFHARAVGPLEERRPLDVVVSYTAAKLRARLVEEECNELLDAIWRNDHAEIADACADLIYVAIGCAATFGIDLPPVWDAVQESNMAKVADGAKRDAGGKVVKGPNWKHPDIGAILAVQRPLSGIYGGDISGE